MSTPTPSGSSPESDSDDTDAPAPDSESDGDSDTDVPPPDNTTTQIVPVSVPRAVEAEARSRAGRLNEVVEDVLADHVTVVPEYCISPADGERVPVRPFRRVTLHTAVAPELAGLVDELADDRREWVRAAVREKVRRERRRGVEGETPAANDRP